LDITNDFSWSKSRHEKLVECPRAYWYHYYGSWGGWEGGASPAVRELYVLKKLGSRWQWAGSLVHDALKQMLTRAKATGDFLPEDRVIDRVHSRARAEWSLSREKSYWRGGPVVGLLEHEYAEPVVGEEWKRIYEETIAGSLRAFYRSPTFAQLRETPRDRWLSVDVLDSWVFEGTKIWVAIDFAFVDEKGQLQILDWKTGKEREVDHTQVGIYAIYAKKKWNVPVEQIVGGLIYLGAGTAVPVRADAAALEACAGEMRDSIRRMKEPLEDPVGNVARSEAFPRKDDGPACRRCAFRRPCGRL
jgi:hypothetical protein